LNLSGRETYDIPGISALKPQGTVELTIHRDDGSKETVPLRARIDTEVEFEYYRHNGILSCVLRQLSA
ncbi:MAG: hypothetical protein KAT88_13285, partial [Spirochaetes bacterium]|nr:hypothetical protein [Spirochaetota bacterium]